MDQFTNNVEYFSNWNRLYMALSQFISYIEKLKYKAQGSIPPYGIRFEYIQRSKNILLREKNIDLKQVFDRHDEIKWRFNPPAAPHMGGSGERLVRTVKTILYVMCPAFKFNDESLKSAFCEIEFIINTRPLTFVALESAEDDPLTSNHLLLGSTDGYKPLCETNYDLHNGGTKPRNLQTIFGGVRRSKWFEKVKPPSVDDIVIIVDGTLPRNSWPKGVKNEIITAKDGQVRRVKVTTSTSTFERLVTKIAV
ncbi:hypothetical protein CVS40_9673 [Lucilia cuprina]|nr:hypothetical protein CVS40_9673 [Lucilia cuprina]